MTIDQNEANQLLDRLGEQLIEMYDASVENDMNSRIAKSWKELLDMQPDTAIRQRKVVQLALEHLLHDFLFYLQEQREFRIQALTKNGEWVNIDEYSDGIHGDLFGWLEEKSKFGCVTNEWLNIRLADDEDQ